MGALEYRGRHPLRRQPPQHRFHRGALAGDERLRRSIDGNDGDSVAERLDGAGHPRLAGLQHGHHVGSRKIADQFRARGNQAERILEREESRHARGDILPRPCRAPPQVRCPTTATVEKRALESKQHRVGKARVVTSRVRSLVAHGSDQRDAECRAQQLVAAFDRAAKNRLAVEQPASDARQSRLLTGEQERDAQIAAWTDHPARDFGGALDTERASQHGRGLLGRGGAQRQAVIETGASDIGREARVGELLFVVSPRLRRRFYALDVAGASP